MGEGLSWRRRWRSRSWCGRWGWSRLGLWTRVEQREELVRLLGGCHRLPFGGEEREEAGSASPTPRLAEVNTLLRVRCLLFYTGTDANKQTRIQSLTNGN